MTKPKLTRRDHLAMNAPITREMVDAVWGDTDVEVHKDDIRAGYFAVWTLLCYEWADAMIDHADNWKTS